MDRTPSYHQPSKKLHNGLFSRNYSCPYYDRCLQKAAYEDLFLDCKDCGHRDDLSESYILGNLVPI
jgi:hypothetical protein